MMDHDLGMSFPYKLPESFKNVFAVWEQELGAHSDGIDVQKAAKKLTFEELLVMASPHHFPTLRPELYRFALNELLSRKLTEDQKQQVGIAWESVRSYAKGSGKGPLISLSNVRRLNKLIS